MDATRFKLQKRNPEGEQRQAGERWAPGGHLVGSGRDSWVQGTSGALPHPSDPPTPFNRQSTFDFRLSEVWEAGKMDSPASPVHSPGAVFHYFSLIVKLQTPQRPPRPFGVHTFRGLLSPCAACRDLSLGTSSSSCHSIPVIIPSFSHFPFSSSHLRLPSSHPFIS